MITLIEAKHYRCLRYIRQRLSPFHVLVGPNASGKTTFLDVVAFLGELVANGPLAAVDKRTRNFHDLLWWRAGESFELAVEADIPERLRPLLRDPACDTVRYEIALRLDDHNQEISIQTEKVLFKAPASISVRQGVPFPVLVPPPDSIITPMWSDGTRVVLNKVPNGNDNFYSEVDKAWGKDWDPSMSIKFGPQRSALGNLPADEANFPVTSWLKHLLAEEITQLTLNSLKLRQASAPGQGRRFKADGSNLPWVVEHFKSTAPDRFRLWLAHLRTALPDLMDVRTVEREDDRHRYLMLDYGRDLEVPSWMVSDGTLRLMALTILAYLPGFSGTYLIEEPENGIHPKAVETMFQSISSAYDAQILVATHSPIILSMVEVDKVLCFGKNQDGSVDIVRGDEHPALRDWKGEENLGVLFAGGVLG